MITYAFSKQYTLWNQQECRDVFLTWWWIERHPIKCHEKCQNHIFFCSSYYCNAMACLASLWDINAMELEWRWLKSCCKHMLSHWIWDWDHGTLSCPISPRLCWEQTFVQKINKQCTHIYKVCLHISTSYILINFQGIVKTWSTKKEAIQFYLNSVVIIILVEAIKLIISTN